MCRLRYPSAAPAMLRHWASTPKGWPSGRWRRPLEIRTPTPARSLPCWSARRWPGPRGLAGRARTGDLLHAMRPMRRGAAARIPRKYRRAAPRRRAPRGGSSPDVVGYGPIASDTGNSAHSGQPAPGLGIVRPNGRATRADADLDPPCLTQQAQRRRPRQRGPPAGAGPSHRPARTRSCTGCAGRNGVQRSRPAVRGPSRAGRRSGCRRSRP